MSGLRKSMLVSSLFLFWQRCLQIISNLVADCPQIISRKAVTCPQLPSILHPMSAEMTIHMQIGRKNTFSCLLKACLQYDRRWHTLVRDGHKSTANLLSFRGIYSSKLRPLWALCWCFAMTSACKYRRLLGQSFEHACLWANRTCMHTCMHTSPDEISVKYWQAHVFCGELQAAKIVPRNFPARLARKGVTGA